MLSNYNICWLTASTDFGCDQPCVPAWRYCPETATAGSSWHRQRGDPSPRPAAERWSSRNAPARSVAPRGTAATLQMGQTRVQGVARHNLTFDMLQPSCWTPHANIHRVFWRVLHRHHFGVTDINTQFEAIILEYCLSFRDQALNKTIRNSKHGPNKKKKDFKTTSRHLETSDQLDDRRTANKS